MRPVLGIIADTKVLDGDPAQVAKDRYVRAAIQHADAAVLIIPSLPDLMTAAEAAARLDGVLLTGSPSNIDAQRYGEARAGDGPFDPDRDRMTADLIAALTGAGKPVFGVCRGFQEVNVALGGTLRRDVGANDPVHHHAPEGTPLHRQFEWRHPVRLQADGVLRAALGGEDVQVNSVHYQGIDKLAPVLTAEAHAPDGLVEAVSGRIGGAPIVAVQWHPEWDADRNPESLAFFHLLGRALRGEPLTQGHHA